MTTPVTTKQGTVLEEATIAKFKDLPSVGNCSAQAMTATTLPAKFGTQ